MILVNKDYLEKLNPCLDRFENYLKYYKNWKGSLDQFLDLPELAHHDKTFVFFKSITTDKQLLVAADIAERVLHFYENKYPNDDRPRKAIETIRSKNIYINASSARVAAYDAASSVNSSDAAYYAAYAAAYAIDTFYTKDARYTVAYALEAASFNEARSEEENAQIEIMKKYINEPSKVDYINDLNNLLLKSFEAHMNWILPKVNKKQQAEANFAKAHIVAVLNSGRENPEEMSGDPVWSVYGEKVFDTYKEIYYNNYKRFVEGRGTETAIERIL